MTTITPKFSHVSGSFDMATGKLVLVAKHKYRSVTLCLSDSVNIPFAEILLLEKGFASLSEVFSDAQALGEEIILRWNNHVPMSIDDIRGEFEEWYAADMSKKMGKTITAESIKNHRDSESYSASFGAAYLNGCWEGWKASRERALEIVPLKRVKP